MQWRGKKRRVKGVGGKTRKEQKVEEEKDEEEAHRKDWTKGLRKMDGDMHEVKEAKDEMNGKSRRKHKNGAEGG